MSPMQTTNNTEVTTTEATIDRYVVMFNEADDAIRTKLAHEVWVDDGRTPTTPVGGRSMITLFCT